MITLKLLFKILKFIINYKQVHLMKKLILPMIILTSLSTQAALVQTMGGAFSEAGTTLKCMPNSLVHYDTASLNPCKNPLSSTTSIPSILIMDSDVDMTNDEKAAKLITEMLDESKELTVTKAVAEYLDLTVEDIQIAVSDLYENSDVSIKNIKRYYGL